MNNPHTPLSSLTVSSPTLAGSPNFYLSALKPIPDSTGQRFYITPPGDVSSRLSQDLEINAQILFPNKDVNMHPSKGNTRVDESLNRELQLLKQVVLSQQNLGRGGTNFPSPTKRQPKVEALGSIKAFPHLPIPQPKGFRMDEILLPPPMYLGNGTEGMLTQKKVIGKYTLEERRKKIMRYKDKLNRWRRMHPISRAFSGRRKIAFLKQRNNGRFTKHT